jgi:hypothetical protein
VGCRLSSLNRVRPSTLQLEANMTMDTDFVTPAILLVIALTRDFSASPSHLGTYANPQQYGDPHRFSLQLGVFGFGGDEDGDVRIGVFPEGEEVLVRVTGIGLVGLCGVGARYSELCQW